MEGEGDMVTETEQLETTESKELDWVNGHYYKVVQKLKPERSEDIDFQIRDIGSEVGEDERVVGAIPKGYADVYQDHLDLGPGSLKAFNQDGDPINLLTVNETSDVVVGLRVGEDEFAPLVLPVSMVREKKAGVTQEIPTLETRKIKNQIPRPWLAAKTALGYEFHTKNIYDTSEHPAIAALVGKDEDDTLYLPSMDEPGLVENGIFRLDRYEMRVDEKSKEMKAKNESAVESKMSEEERIDWLADCYPIPIEEMNAHQKRIVASASREQLGEPAEKVFDDYYELVEQYGEQYAVLKGVEGNGDLEPAVMYKEGDEFLGIVGQDQLGADNQTILYVKSSNGDAVPLYVPHELNQLPDSGRVVAGIPLYLFKSETAEVADDNKVYIADSENKSRRVKGTVYLNMPTTNTELFLRIAPKYIS